MKPLSLVIVCSLLATGLLKAESDVLIERWLFTEAVEVKLPAFYDSPDTKGNTFSVEQLLGFAHVNMENMEPETGQNIQWMQGQNSQWATAQTDQNGQLILRASRSSNNPQVVFLATYIKVDRWMEARLELSSPYIFEVWVNGEKIGSKTAIDQDTPGGSLSRNLELVQGTHLVLVKALKPAGEDLLWNFSGRIHISSPFEQSNIQAVTSPQTIKNIHHFMDGVKVSSVQPSPDGSMVAVSYRQSLPPSDRSETWTDIRRTSDYSLVHSFRYASISRLTWLPNSNGVVYTTVQDGKTSIHCHHMETGQKNLLAEGIENFGGMRWSPTESFIIYWVTDRGSGAGDTMRHILGMQDRQGGFRHRSFLYKLDLHSMTKTRLTYGNLTTSLHDISPDGRKMVFSQSWPDYLERPYSKHNLYIMDLETYQVDTLLKNQRWGVSTLFSPDGQYLLATGGPSAFDRAGENIPEGMIANNYDTQAFVFSLNDHSIDPITLNFDPSVSSVHWHPEDGHIYILAGDQDRQRLFRYNVRRRSFEPLETGTDFITQLAFASNARMATYIGNKTNAPHVAYHLNLRSDRYEMLDDFDGERYGNVVFGEVHDWDFISNAGQPIKGRYYLPPDFDPNRKYPVIVYQYGGTNPVGRTFGGRYPFNLWAGHGYIVYVLQPSGATGFGQAFSAAHVNNWGITVADEIIEGTKKFLEAHPFANPDKVGVAGASYGGFMTMLLTTRTDIYAAAISHAGISNIASYWGEGYWGYGYSAEATANSFPWNDESIYVGQSPLYSAHTVNTPLLLITGDSDTNVPPGESIQMYTALKMLGRPVELVLVEGEDHHIITYNKRLKWHDAIMAFWDRHLKDEAEWWEKQYPENNY